MVKEIERANIPTAHITNMKAVAQVIGSNRIVPGIAITNPCSDVTLPEKEQKEVRKNIILRALEALETDVTEQTIF